MTKFPDSTDLALQNANKVLEQVALQAQEAQSTKDHQLRLYYHLYHHGVIVGGRVNLQDRFGRYSAELSQFVLNNGNFVLRGVEVISGTNPRRGNQMSAHSLFARLLRTGQITCEVECPGLYMNPLDETPLDFPDVV